MHRSALATLASLIVTAALLISIRVSASDDLIDILADAIEQGPEEIRNSGAPTGSDDTLLASDSVETRLHGGDVKTKIDAAARYGGDARDAADEARTAAQRAAAQEKTGVPESRAIGADLTAEKARDAASHAAIHATEERARVNPRP